MAWQILGEHAWVQLPRFPVQIQIGAGIGRPQQRCAMGRRGGE